MARLSAYRVRVFVLVVLPMTLGGWGCAPKSRLIVTVMDESGRNQLLSPPVPVPLRGARDQVSWDDFERVGDNAFRRRTHIVASGVTNRRGIAEMDVRWRRDRGQAGSYYPHEVVATFAGST